MMEQKKKKPKKRGPKKKQNDDNMIRGYTSRRGLKITMNRLPAPLKKWLQGEDE